MTQKFFKIDDNLLNIISGLKQITYTPIMRATIVLSMAFALFFSAIFSMLWNSRDTIHDRWNESAEISLHLKKNVASKIATDLLQKLQKSPIVTKAELISPDEGMKAFAENTALGTLFSSLKENPLPQVIIIHPKLKVLSKNLTATFIQELKKVTEIETVVADTNWIERSYNWLNLWESLSLILLFTLTINALLIISGISYIAARNLSLNSSSTKEALLCQFAWYGLIGSVLSLILTRSITAMLCDQDIFVQGLNIGFSILIVIGCSLLSFISAKIAACSSNHTT